VKIALTAYTASFPRAHYSDKLGIVVKAMQGVALKLKIEWQ